MCYIYIIFILQTTPNLPESKISQLEQGIQASKCNLPHSFECTEERGADGERKFVGAIMFGDLCIARGEDEKFKKQCKEATYNKVRTSENSADSDQTSPKEQSDQDLLCFPTVL